MEAGLCEGEGIVVVGGGNSAGQAAVYLSRHAAHVHMLIRGAALAASMSSYLSDRIEASTTRITLHTHSEITALGGARQLVQVTWADSRTGQETTRPVTALFLVLGAVPNTGWLGGQLALDERGFVRSGPSAALESSVPGIFAVGDVRSGSTKRVASGVGEGSVVVSSVHEHLARTGVPR